ncbi:GMC family oxidoreductase [Sphingomonas sp. MMS24-J13]|uniref:GMC family oxidoreductase n=1 Tax=Sphingomonas sp. MMS24-J13 TaxID=3238686 RepID=UPI00384DADF8
MEEFDYIVVGAGSAGCVVAARLSEDPNVKVLLLEAGGPNKHPYLKMPLGFLKAVVDPRFNWGFLTEPEPGLGGRQLPLPRGRVLGGSSSINGMFYMRGHPGDYDQWRQMGASGWGFADVLPYFKRMEKSWRGEGKYHGASGPVEVNSISSPFLLHEPLMEAAPKAGFPTSEDLAGDNPEGFARGEQTIDGRGRRVSAATAYLKPALGRPNLEVRTGALTHKVVFNGNRAVGVDYEMGGERKVARCRREVIISGGAFNSPHLLMLSGIGPANELTEMGIKVVAHSPGVGRNLSEHANVSLEWDAKQPVTFLRHLRFDKLVLSTLRWALLGSGPMATQLNSCNIVVRTRPDYDRPDLQVMANPIRFDAKIWFPGFTERQSHVFWAGLVALHPHSRGWVKLKSADPRDLPAVQLNLMTDPADLAQMRDAIRAVRRIYRTEPQGSLLGAERLPGEAVESDDALDAFIRATCYVAMHPVGTCAMGMGAESVVDSELKVIGVKGLRVVDASVMPTVPGGNTNAPVMMVGEKAADLIRGRSLPRAEI